MDVGSWDYPYYYLFVNKYKEKGVKKALLYNRFNKEFFYPKRKPK
jgi:hypothetical protein